MPTPNSILSGSARRALRAAAHHLDPVVTIGQAGLTPAVLHEIDVALTAHALIKVRVSSDDRAEREAHLAQVCAQLRCEPVQHLGKLLVLWRNREGDDAPVDAAIDQVPRKPERGPRKALRASEPPAHPAPGPRRREPIDRFTTPRSPGAERAPREGWAPRDRRGTGRLDDRGMASWRDDGTRRREGESSARTGRPPRSRTATVGDARSAAPRGTGTGRRDQRAAEAPAQRRLPSLRGTTGRADAPTAPRSRWGERRPREATAEVGDGVRARRRRDPATGGSHDAPVGKPPARPPRTAGAGAPAPAPSSGGRRRRLG